jgi:dethiobiotin synthetase
MRAVFIAGTDTGVGKTVVAGLLGRYLASRGYRAITQKWIQTGGKGFAADIHSHLKIMGKTAKDIKEGLPYTCTYAFKFPASPHLAARLEGKRIEAYRIKRSFKALSSSFDPVIVEGIGGALVPFDQKNLVIDIARDLKLPVLIIAGNKLGAINHTLLTVEAVQRRGMKILGIIFNQTSGKTDTLISKDNPRIIKDLTKETILGGLPYMQDKDALYYRFIPMGKRIESLLK